MSNEVVKYHNDLNTVNMRGWTSEEMNFMFAVLAKAKEKGTESIEMDKSQLIGLAQYSNQHNMALYDVLKNLVDHVTEMKYIESTTHSYKVMNLFQSFEVVWSADYSEMNASITVSPKFEYILNKLNAQFTRFELEEFVQLRSTYAKQMYRLLKQWRSKGEKEYSVQDFRYLLAIPKCYKASDIGKRVIKPILKELNPMFKDLKIKPIKKRTKGNPIIAYRFTWKATTQADIDAEKRIAELPKWQQETDQQTASEDLKKEVEELQNSL